MRQRKEGNGGEEEPIRNVERMTVAEDKGGVAVYSVVVLLSAQANGERGRVRVSHKKNCTFHNSLWKR